MADLQARKSVPFVQTLLKIVISTSLIVWLFQMIEWDQALQVIREGSLFYFGAAFIAIQLTVLSSVWKWKLLVDSAIKGKSKANTSLTKLGKFYYIGLFFNNFLPGSVGGDVVRIYHLGRIVGVPPAATSVAIERLTSGVALVGIVLVASFTMENVRPFLFSVYLITILVALLLWLIWYWINTGDKGESKTKTLTTPFKKLNDSLSKGKKVVSSIRDIAANYRNESWKWWLSIVILSILFQMGLAWINQLLFLALGIEVPWLELLVIITLISVITMLPVSLNGLGVREGSYVFFFNQLGVPNEMAIAVSLLFFTLVSLSSLVGGLFWLSERRKTG
jgi:glycosyltransferase 2 family protein